jgi:hypothetical protein
MDIISRAEWGARPPRSIYTTTWDRRKIFVVHYSGASASQSVRSIQDYCMDHKGYSDIDYNALVDTAGRIYEGRIGIWLTIGSHTLNHNTEGIGVCYIGEDTTPLTEAAKTAIRWLFDEANRLKADAGFPTPLDPGPHSRWVSTSCPGDTIRAWLNQGMPASGAPAGGDDDMFCRKGDTGEKVKALQLQLLQLDPNALPKYGADGGYGDETEYAVAWYITGDYGGTYGAREFAILQRKAAETVATKGERGDPGPAGPAGPQGEPGTAAVIAPGTTLQVVVAA